MDEMSGGTSRKSPQENQENFAEWKTRYEKGEENPRELFQQVSKIAQFMSYDLVDKLQYWERETMKLPDSEIERRVKHVSRCLTQLQSAYVQFSEVDF